MQKLAVTSGQADTVSAKYQTASHIDSKTFRIKKVLMWGITNPRGGGDEKEADIYRGGGHGTSIQTNEDRTSTDILLDIAERMNKYKF